MIHDRDVAARLSNLMIEIAGKMNDSIRLVQQRCTEAEFQAYRRAASRVMGAVRDVMNPLYEAHPDLKPEALD